MSVIDYTIHIFKCEICGVVEQVKINDYGNEFNGSSWQFGPKLKKFDVSWNGGEKKEPEVMEAICKNCLARAEHSIRW